MPTNQMGVLPVHAQLARTFAGATAE